MLCFAPPMPPPVPPPANPEQPQASGTVAIVLVILIVVCALVAPIGWASRSLGSSAGHPAHDPALRSPQKG